jgi:hypothetical protein
MLIAAVAVSVGCVPVLVPSLVASPNSVEHPEECVTVLPETVSAEFTHVARMLPNVLSVACGAVPLPAGVVSNAVPELSDTRFVALANAFTMPYCACVDVVFPVTASSSETSVASTAKPDIAYAAAIVETSFMNTNETVPANVPLAGH